MDILNFISWIKGGRVVTSVNATQTLLPVGLKDPKRDDGYLSGAITVDDFAQSVAPFVTPGPAGPQGVAGPAGVPGPVGPAGLNWQGTWVSGASYVLDDAVGYAGASYFCIAPTSGTTAPNLATANWALLASQGAIGPQGPQGPTGAQGPSGNPISFLEYNLTDKTVWNNGQGNITSNTSFGSEALKANTIGGGNTSIGEASLRANTSGSNNTGVGSGALLLNTTGSSNTSLGVSALESNTTGNNNVSIGVASLQNGITATDNTAIGAAAGFSITTGAGNTAIGGLSLGNLQTGFSNVGIGYNTSVTSSSTTNAVLIGRSALGGTNSVVIGSGASSGAYTAGVILGIGATATANNQFVIGSIAQAAGTVTTETVASTKTWSVVINGVGHKILLA
jgi:hypothetical protein